MLSFFEPRPPRTRRMPGLISVIHIWSMRGMATNRQPGFVNTAASQLLRLKFAIFGGIALMPPAQRRRGNPVAQVDNVHSVLRLNYETLRELISLPSSRVANLRRL
jgi:hypothetical protein